MKLRPVHLGHGLSVAGQDLREHGRLWVTLGAASLGLASSITVLSLFGGRLLSHFTTSDTLIGFALGGEGLFALALPLLIGPLSDRTRSRLGRRRPFILTGVLIASASLVLTPLMPSYWSAVGVIFAFYVGYYLIGIPYRALSTDTLPASHYARALGYQQLLRGVGFLVAYGVGFALFPVWRAYPFIIIAGLLLASGLVTVVSIQEPAHPEQRTISLWRELYELLHDWRARQELRRALVANFFFEANFAGMRNFIVLFFLQGLGLSFSWIALAVGIVALANIGGSLVSGYAADRFGVRRVLYWSNLVFAVALAIPFFWQPLWMVFAVLPPIAVVGASIITLSFPMIMEIMPENRRGGYSGIFELVRGLGIATGSLFVGGAIDLWHVLGGGHRGYDAMWLALAILSALAALALRRLGLASPPARTA